MTIMSILSGLGWNTELPQFRFLPTPLNESNNAFAPAYSGSYISFLQTFRFPRKVNKHITYRIRAVSD